MIPHYAMTWFNGGKIGQRALHTWSSYGIWFWVTCWWNGLAYDILPCLQSNWISPVSDFLLLLPSCGPCGVYHRALICVSHGTRDPYLCPCSHIPDRGRAHTGHIQTRHKEINSCVVHEHKHEAQIQTMTKLAVKIHTDTANKHCHTYDM